jgi:hypothetical protein
LDCRTNHRGETGIEAIFLRFGPKSSIHDSKCST